jgi:predicted HTH domain antitoxin
MLISLPEDMERRFTPQDMRLLLALGLFLDNRVTLGQGAEIAGISQSEFLRELGNRRIAVHYGGADAAADVDVVNRWAAGETCPKTNSST